LFTHARTGAASPRALRRLSEPLHAPRKSDEPHPYPAEAEEEQQIVPPCAVAEGLTDELGGWPRRWRRYMGWYRRRGRG